MSVHSFSASQNKPPNLNHKWKHRRESQGTGSHNHPVHSQSSMKPDIADECQSLKPGFHIVVFVVRKKFIGRIQLYGNLPYKCSIQKKRQIQLVVRDRMNSICPMNFFRTTDTTIWKPGLRLVDLCVLSWVQMGAAGTHNSFWVCMCRKHMLLSFEILRE